MIDNDVLSLAIDDNYLWVGTDSGLSGYDKKSGEWRNFPLEDGLVNNRVESIVADEDYVWVGTWGGVSRITVKRLEDVD